MNDDLTTLNGTREAVWSMLAEAPNAPDAPARTLVLSTQSKDGGGAARMVILRAADREAEQLTIFTHRA